MRFCSPIRPWTVALTGAVICLLRAIPAHAHLVTTGLGPVYDGISHLALTPEDLVPTLAVGLLAGLGGARYGRMTLFAVPAAWLVGGLAGLVLKTAVNPYLTTVSFLVLGGLVAADLKLSHRVMITLISVFGLFHGYLNGSVMAQAKLGILGLIGITVTVFVIIALVTGFVVSLKAKWTRIAVRVAGSWIAAMGILLLGWAVKGW
jgi:hydrogenase/urease accessory protein HupE